MPHSVYDSPVGPLSVFERDGAIVRVSFGDTPNAQTSPLLAAALEQLYGYFYCQLEAFELPLAPAGTRLQQEIWAAMRAIPRGQVRTYGDLARAVGRPRAARAAGTACAGNPIPIFIPCHRVVAAHGIGGYSGGDGLATKRALLSLEGVSLSPR